MNREGLLHPDVDERWMGVVFPGGLFEPTGEWVLAGDASPRTRPGGGGSGMPRQVKVWRLKSGVMEPPMPEDVLKPGLLEEAIGPSQPTRDEFREALSDIRKMYEAAKGAGFKHAHKGAGLKLAKWMRYMAEEGGS